MRLVRRPNKLGTLMPFSRRKSCAMRYRAFWAKESLRTAKGPKAIPSSHFVDDGSIRTNETRRRTINFFSHFVDEEIDGVEIIEQFAERFRVKTRRDECGDTIIPGKQHKFADGQSNIFAGFDNGHFGVALLFGTKTKWTYARRKLEAAGFHIQQLGETEGVLTFDPANNQQARLAIKAAGVRTKKNMAPPSAAQLAQREKFAASRRPAVEATA
jgi:hypothetical protein